MLGHCRAVARGAERPLLALDTAVRILKYGEMDAIKLEGGSSSRTAAAKTHFLDVGCARVGDVINKALVEYKEEVKNGSFPGPLHSPYKISEIEINGFISELQELGLDKAAASTAAAGEKNKTAGSSNGPANDCSQSSRRASYSLFPDQKEEYSDLHFAVEITSLVGVPNDATGNILFSSFVEGERNGGFLGDEIVNLALKFGLARQDNFNRMNGLMAKLVEMDIQPNVVTFGILIYHTCKFTRVDAALEVLEKMCAGKESGGLSVSVEPVVVIYKTLIEDLAKLEGKQRDWGFCKAGEGQKGKELFDEMNKDGVAPNVVTIGTLVGGMCRTGRVGRVVEVRRRGLRGNAVAYSALISAFCNVNNFENATEFFNEMLTSGCSPDAIVYYNMISGFSQDGRMDDGSLVLSKWKEVGFRHDTVCYDVLIGGFCRKIKFNRVFALLKEMDAAGLEPAIAYNTLIALYQQNCGFKVCPESPEKDVLGRCGAH
ncbi:PREDICTED: pentatricopeptide repeat-containing protein At3g61520, mitochondrial-like [Populus euphratica]|uniref:Pentatricopeptide repeat-containing protein At3g61520, mitochondrial-like n=1 Tax=Populus euphratica TaxID=75702 RepID=A0AAJ6TRU7_POPEU|nr:PREDICTED: pentatricopeptide repeat-containing protein At3g61520, mitochondrial-like [Populus euphratica]